MNLEFFIVFGLRSFFQQTFVPGRLLSRLLISDFCPWADFWSTPDFCSQEDSLIPRGLLITELLFPKLLFTGLKFPGLLFPSGLLFPRGLLFPSRHMFLDILFELDFCSPVNLCCSTFYFNLDFCSY